MSEDKNNLFALDIGTRNVVGLVYQPLSEGIKIRSFAKKDHKERCMFDGQIHDIQEVADIIKDIKTELEKKLNLQLNHVAVAAAGRSLLTEKAFIEKDRELSRRINSEEISALEMQAVQKAQEKTEMTDREHNDTDYHCVGYTIINYYLNGHPISNLSNQKGNKIGVEVIATFLPQVVIDGLEGAMEEVGLKISSLTLEPIAAINLAIPKEIRMLNLALVDIGAGTSDIAITKDGTVVAYKMVPLAGDEITEKLCKELLVDFNTAEEIKLSLSKAKDVIKYKDVLGVTKSIKKAELMELIQAPLNTITDAIAENIKEINEGPPSAVFCIGGGSQLPTIEDKLAEKLQLDKERVTIKGDENWEKVKNLRKGLKGPQGVTPLGIALSSCEQKDFGFFYVTINDRLVRLFGKDQVKVADALIAAGYGTKKLIASTGKGLKITLNGKEKYFPGDIGFPATILVNGENAGLETTVKNNDDIYVEEAKQGTQRRLKAKELFYEIPKWDYFYLKDDKVNFPYEIKVNGKKVLPEKQIFDGSEVEIKPVKKVKGLSEYLELDLDNYEIICEGQVLSEEDMIEDGARLNYRTKKENIKQIDNIDKSETVTHLKEKDVFSEVLNKDRAAAENNYLNIEVNEEKLQVKKTKEPKFLDIFQHVDFDTSINKGDLIMKINDEPAEFTSPIKDGDRLVIFWSDEGIKQLDRIN